MKSPIKFKKTLSVQSFAEEASSIKKRRLFYLAFATMTLLVLGLVYAWSLFARPIGVAYSEYVPMLSQVFQVSMFSYCLAALVGAQIFKKVSPRAAIFTAAALFGSGFVLSAACAGFGVWALFLFYGVIAASGCGIGFNAIIALVNPWFPDRPGFASGAMMVGFGISSLVFGSLADAAFMIVSDWKIVFYAIALGGVLCLLAFGLAVQAAPQDISFQLGMDKASAAARISPTRNKSMFKTKVFWLFCVWATAIAACGLTTIGSAAQGAELLGAAAPVAVLLVGLVSTMNGVSRIFIGILFDRFGLVAVMLLSALLALAATLGLAGAFALGGGNVSVALYIVAAIAVACPFGSVPVLASVYARQRHNPEEFSYNFGFTNGNVAWGAALNIGIAAVLGSPYGGNGALIYTFLAALAVVALLVACTLRKPYAKDLAAIQKELQGQ